MNKEDNLQCLFRRTKTVRQIMARMTGSKNDATEIREDNHQTNPKLHSREDVQNLMGSHQLKAE